MSQKKQAPAPVTAAPAAVPATPVAQPKTKKAPTKKRPMRAKPKAKASMCEVVKAHLAKIGIKKIIICNDTASSINTFKDDHGFNSFEVVGLADIYAADQLAQFIRANAGISALPPDFIKAILAKVASNG